MSKHVEALFSAAYDGELGADARARFDRHLAECAACAAAFAQLTTAVDALRELTPARMPRPVRLPEGSPVPERRFGGLALLLPRGRGLVAGLTAAGMVAAAGGIAAVVLTRDLGPARSSAAGSVGQQVVGGNSGLAPAAGPAVGPLIGSGSAASVPETSCGAQYLGTDATAASEPPSGFTNREISDDGVTAVVVATTPSSFAPGGTVPIYVRLIDDSSGTVYLPCAVVEGPVGGSPGATVTVPAIVAVPTPVAWLTADGQPVLDATIPALAAAGETFQIVVEVPAGAGERQAREVILPIQIG